MKTGAVQLLRRMAVPSWCIAGSIEENACFLAGRVQEIALCLFETEACLRYDAHDLPPALAALPLSWHVHLPLDLDWSQGALPVFALCRTLLGKCAFLQPHAVVLHPPVTNIQNDCRLMQHFFALWAEWQPQGFKPSLCLENLDGHDFLPFLPLIQAAGAAICLDLGHALAHDTRLLECADILKQTRIVHFALCDVQGRHLPLSAASLSEQQTIQQLFQFFAARKSATLVLELFNWQHVLDSAHVLCGMTA